MKVMAIASAGGHWVQLLRLKPSFENHELVFVSTKASFAETVTGNTFYAVPDASRWNKLKLPKVGFCIAKVIIKEKPNVIITTGAAPGLMAIIIGRALGAKTIWVDSIANAERLSMSGKIALFFANRVYTQWPHLQKNKVHHKGNVLL